MINIKLICIGKVKEKSMQDLIDEYLKKISKFAKVEIIELPDEKIPDNASLKDEEKIKLIESDRIINIINKIGKTHIFILDLKGKEYTSVELSKKIENSLLTASTLTFIIGGSLGMSEKLKKYSDDLISFSKLTFPHQLFRVFLLEQIYRSFKIMNNETYHK